MPYQIRQANAQLMVESTKVCYDRFRVNKNRMRELEEEISELRAKLRMKVLEEQERQMQDERMYAYLHSMLGARLMEELDEALEQESRNE